MVRLSDRAFKVIELEIDSLHNQGVIDKLDTIILSARLCTLREKSGKHLTRAQVWDTLCDVIPEIDSKVLTSAAANGKNLSDIRIAAGVGATAVLAASTFGMEATTASVNVPDLSASEVSQNEVKSQVESVSPAESRADNPIMKRLPLVARFTRTGVEVSESAAFAQAKRLGWEASLKGANPPYSSQHWRETAGLWRKAIVYLNQVPKRYADYEAVEKKIAFYERNLAEVEGRWTAAIAREAPTQISSPAPSGQANAPKFSGANTVREVDYLAIARRHGWQASVAGQNAPHPAQKWADISRRWKTALHHLEQVPAESAQYEEVQQVKATYQQNLAEVRQHYRQEQAASQTVASLQAALGEIERSGAHRQVKDRQNQAILAKLRAIPVGTDAYLQAQRAIAQLNGSDSEEIVAASN